MARQVDVKALISHIIRGDGADRCRICMGDTSEGQVYLGDTVMLDGDRPVTLSELLEIIAGVEVEITSLLPNQLCGQCVDNAMKTYQFIQFCKETSKQLTNVYDFIQNLQVSGKTATAYVVIDEEIKLYTDTANTTPQTTREVLKNFKRKVSQRRSAKKLNDVCKELKSRGVLQCPECRKSFDTKVRFNSHIRVLNLKMCGHCRDIYNIKDFKQHLESHNIRPYTCKICSRVFQVEKDFKSHEKRCSKGKSLCYECNRTFANNAHLLSHLHTHKTRFCNGCERKFTSWACFKHHTKNCTHVKPKTKLYICDYCSKEFRHRTSFVLHIETHMTGLQYQCEHCGKTFGNIFHLKEHDNTHNKVEDRYVCSVCGKKYSTRRGYERHVKKHDLKEVAPKVPKARQRPTCNVCNSTFSSRKKLNYHLSNVHKVII